MTTQTAEIDFLKSIDRLVRSLQDEARGVLGRSDRRWLWELAADGWVRLRDLHEPGASPAERKARQRLIERLEADGLVQCAESEGRVVDVRLTPDGLKVVRRRKP